MCLFSFPFSIVYLCEPRWAQNNGKEELKMGDKNLPPIVHDKLGIQGFHVREKERQKLADRDQISRLIPTDRNPLLPTLPMLAGSG